MEIDVKELNDTFKVVLKGDIEMMTIKELKNKLLDLGQNSDKNIDLNMSEVNYIDSSGVGILISLLKIQKKKGKEMTISEISDKVLSVLKLSSLSDVFNL